MKQHEGRSLRKSVAFPVRLLQTCAIGLLAVSWISAAIAAPLSAGPASSRALGPAAGRPGSSAASTAAPEAVLPDVLLEGGGVNIGSTYLPYVSSGPPTVHSTVMINSPNGTRGLGCRFPVSFRLKNVGGSPTPSSFDVYFSIIQGPPFAMGEPVITSVGFAMNQLNPGAIGSENSGFDILPGSYGFRLSVDPHHRFKQAGPPDRAWLFAFKVTCGNGVFAPAPGGPAAHIAAPGAAIGPGSHGILPAQPPGLRRVPAQGDGK
jgi:hypothetical protein